MISYPAPKAITMKSIAECSKKVENVIGSMESKALLEGVLAKDKKWLERIPPNYRFSLDELIGRYSSVVASYTQAQSCITDAWKHYYMVRKYPWREKEISRSEHLHFVWVGFVNCCYTFEERVKTFYNEWNGFREFVGQEKLVCGGRKVSLSLAHNLCHFI